MGQIITDINAMCVLTSHSLLRIGRFMTTPGIRSNHNEAYIHSSNYQNNFGYNVSREERRQNLVNLLEQLNSQDEKTAYKADEELTQLQNCGFPYNLIQESLPIFPIDVEALKQIALEPESQYPLFRERAFEACSYLCRARAFKESYEIAATLAAQKMQSEDEDVQKEGFKYFALLIMQWKPELSQQDLTLAIAIAKKMLETDSWNVANRFFTQLVTNGREESVALLKSAVSDLLSNESGYSHKFLTAKSICEAIVTNHQNLVDIPLEAATSMCNSENSTVREDGWNLFWSLLHLCPEKTIDPLLQAFKTAPKRENERTPLLLEAITNLSTSGPENIKEEMLSLKWVAERRN